MKWILRLGALAALGIVALVAYAVLVLAPGLPALDALTDYPRNWRPIWD